MKPSTAALDTEARSTSMSSHVSDAGTSMRVSSMRELYQLKESAHVCVIEQAPPRTCRWSPNPSATVYLRHLATERALKKVVKSKEPRAEKVQASSPCELRLKGLSARHSSAGA